ncbi:universal stress protein [Moorella sp. Hama-1]|uniref:universal stress protein n=1 Tax=Moorella sp. Hama-1 TaxID=2138101 RepID=UPI000D656478|nr:universal stress protein [Moorella sp. Hama-1]BCV22053.1 universal stress protein UspA [Moorella sp. Hama-1]
MKVLVPVDGSDNSMRAVDYALQMVKNHPTVEVTLLAVACHYETRYIEGYALDGELLSKQCQEQFGEVLVKARQVFKDAGVEVKTEMVTGDPGTAITAYVEDNAIDRVVMGSRGLSPFKGMILGSVTYKVLHNVKVPVTIVK